MDKTIRARALRRQPTAAETLLWAQLRDRRLGGFKFRRQRPIGVYFVDFVCVERRLVVEVDGEPHDLTFEHDSVRDATLTAAGYRVVRFGNDDSEQSGWRAADDHERPRNGTTALTLTLSRFAGEGNAMRQRPPRSPREPEAPRLNAGSAP